MENTSEPRPESKIKVFSQTARYQPEDGRTSEVFHNTTTSHRCVMRVKCLQVSSALFVNSTPRTLHFLVDTHLVTRTCVAQVVSLACAAHISHHLMRHLHALVLCV